MTHTGMSKPLRDGPHENPPEDTVAGSTSKPHGVRAPMFPFGMSAPQFSRVKHAMLVIVRSVARHTCISPEDAVQQAFVKALSKPNIAPPSIQEEEKFVAYICTLAKYEALTNRNAHRRRALREVSSEGDISEMVAVPPATNSVEARMMLDPAMMTLTTTERDLLRAMYTEDKSIDDIAKEGALPWTTVDYRHKRILRLLSATIKALVVALLVVPKKARAFVAHVAQQGPQLASTMVVTAGFGVLVPTGSSLATESSSVLGLTQVTSNPTVSTEAAGLQASMYAEVAPEEPKEFDAGTNMCSLEDMKSSTFTNIVQETVVPLALIVAPTVCQVGCGGSAQQTPALHAEEEEDAAERRERSDYHYKLMCDQERMRGDKCPTREEWDKSNQPR